MTRVTICVGLITALLCTGCPVRYANTEHEYYIPVPAFVVGGLGISYGASTMVAGELSSAFGDDGQMYRTGAVMLAAGGLTLAISLLYTAYKETQAGPDTEPVIEVPAVAVERWLRCPAVEGDRAAGCPPTGRLTFAQAEGACPEGYRLPTKTELMSLLGGCQKAVFNGRRGRCNPCAQSSACRVAITATNDLVWTASAVEDSAWYANMDDGFLGWRGKDRRAGVVCIEQESKPSATP